MEEINDWNNSSPNCYWCCRTFCDIDVQLADSIEEQSEECLVAD